MTKTLTAFMAIVGLVLPIALPAFAADAPCPRLQDTGLNLGETTEFHPGDAFLTWRATLDKEPDVYINGYHLDASAVQLVAVSPTCYAFNLNRSVMDGDLWKSIRHHSESRYLTRQVTLGFGDAEKISEAVPVTEITLSLIEPEIFWAWVVFFLVLLAATIRLAQKSDLLKDRREDGTTYAYSLAKTQMAFWFFVVAMSLVFVWIITGRVDELNSSVLILMGISSVTFVGASAIGFENGQPGSKTVASAAPAPTPPQDKAKKNFFQQILSDNHGVRLHRFQMASWTLIFGIIFLAEVVGDLSMPDFGGTILGLMGISSGTYLGMKFPEVKA